MAAVLSSVEGNKQWLDGGAMFGNAPRAVWEKWLSPDEKGRIPLSCRGLLIETERQLILCETGIGAFFEPKLADRYGVVETHHVLLEQLQKLGYSDSDITHVILSHLHFDHAGGLLAPYNPDDPHLQLLFPRAHYVVGKTAFERALHPHPRDRASFIAGMPELLQKSGRLVVIGDDGKVVDSSQQKIIPSVISFFFTHGHTPGHMHTTVTSDNQQVTFAGDLIPGRSWVHLPITMGYDRFAEAVIDEKQALYDRIAEQAHWLFFTHDSEVVAAKVSRDAKGRYMPVAEQKVWRKFILE